MSLFTGNIEDSFLKWLTFPLLRPFLYEVAVPYSIDNYATNNWELFHEWKYKVLVGHRAKRTNFKTALKNLSGPNPIETEFVFYFLREEDAVEFKLLML